MTSFYICGRCGSHVENVREAAHADHHAQLDALTEARAVTAQIAKDAEAGTPADAAHDNARDEINEIALRFHAQLEERFGEATADVADQVAHETFVPAMSAMITELLALRAKVAESERHGERIRKTIANMREGEWADEKARRAMVTGLRMALEIVTGKKN